MNKKFLFKDIVCGEEGLLKGPFGSDLKKDLYVSKSSNTLKVYLQENILKKTNDVGEYYISKEYFEEKMSRYEVLENDFIVTCDGTLGEIFQLVNLKEKGIISSSLLRIRLNTSIVDYDYFYYLFKCILKWKLIRKANNSVLKHLPGIKEIRELEIELPPMEVQVKIGSILRNIDNQIERNNAMVQKLQVMVLTRYSVMFQNKANKNALLKDICLLPSGHNFKPEIYNNYGKYKLITIKNVCDTFVEDINTDKISEVPDIKDYCYLSIGDILLSLTGNVGRISIVHSRNNLLNQRVSLLQAKENYKIYSYCLLKSQEYQFIMTNIARGTSQKNLSPIDVENLKIYAPTFEEIKTFNESAENYFNEMLTIKQSTETLIKLKNKLLPLLINGQLDI